MSKKWKSQSSGEAAVSVILQLEKATKISGVDICNECSAFVEVLVGRSSSQDKDYKVTSILEYDQIAFLVIVIICCSRY